MNVYRRHLEYSQSAAMAAVLERISGVTEVTAKENALACAKAELEG